MQRKANLAAYLLLSLVIVGCGGSTQVARVQSDSTIDLSGRWNDTDSRLVAEEMVKDALNQRWIYKYEEAKKVPTVIVGKITNKSHEHISVETFVKDIERSLLNSGSVEFVASKVERQQLRDEVEDQQENASVDTRNDIGEEQGAQLMMTGNISTIVDQEGKKSVIFYQVNMELIELESKKKVWIGEKKIKKYVERAGARL
ncbi:MAG: penicillin-binding protein activator LpoB [Chitinispirillales bacterium]|nr:penicillin-binding protein activator LpoB [Chitinispirillales bacterium]